MGIGEARRGWGWETGVPDDPVAWHVWGPQTAGPDSRLPAYTRRLTLKKRSFSLSLSFSPFLFFSFRRPPTSSSVHLNPLGFSRTAYTYPPTNTTTITSNAAVAATTTADQVGSLSLSRSLLSLFLCLGLPYTYCLWWAPGPAPTGCVIII